VFRLKCKLLLLGHVLEQTQQGETTAHRIVSVFLCHPVSLFPYLLCSCYHWSRDGCTAGDSWLESRQIRRVFLFSKACVMFLGSISLVLNEKRGFVPGGGGGKRPEPVTEHSPPSRIEVKKHWRLPPLRHMISCRAYASFTFSWVRSVINKTSDSMRWVNLLISWLYVLFRRVRLCNSAFFYGDHVSHILYLLFLQKPLVWFCSLTISEQIFSAGVKNVFSFLKLLTKWTLT
jgi:hypothetical protein